MQYKPHCVYRSYILYSNTISSKYWEPQDNLKNTGKSLPLHIYKIMKIIDICIMPFTLAGSTR